MKRILSHLRELDAGLVLPALLAGTSLGVFACGYWLIDLFAFKSRWLPLLTLLIGLFGWVGYLFFFHWIRVNVRGLSNTQRTGLVISSLLIGTFLFFAATDRWQKPDRFVPFLLPTHTLELTVPAGQEPDTVALLWFHTSLGDVSYEEIEYKGWERENERLILADPRDNRLSWTGRTGGEAQILLQSESKNGNVVITWDGQEKALDFAGKKNTFPQTFQMPFYASPVLILLLGVFTFSLISFPLCLLAWRSRGAMLLSIERSMTEMSRRLDRSDGIVILLTMALTISLRIINLENLFPGVEEYNHLLAAKQILQGVPMGEVYSRSLWTVTLPVSLAFRFLGIELWAARLVGVIFNVLAVIPLYLLTRKINRPVAILSILLYATNPWLIAVSRVVREYAYYPFYYYWIVYWMILFMERFPGRFSLRRDWRILFQPPLIWLELFLLLPIVYAIMDISSTFQLILIAYGVLAAFISVRMGFWRGRNLMLLLFMFGILIAGGIVWYRFLPVSLGFNPAALGYFFSNPPQQWYYGRLAVIPLAGVAGGLLLCILVRRLNVIPLFLGAVFGGFLGAFVLSNVNSFGARHVNTTQLWYIPLVAVGLYLIWEFLQTFHLSARGRYWIAALLGLLVFNVQQTLLPILSRDPSMVITEEFHRNLSRVHEYLLTNAREDDALIASRIYTRYVDWVDAPVFRAEYLFDISTTHAELLAFLEQYPSGWIVIDKVRLDSAAFPVTDTLAKDDRISFIGEFDDELVWRWSVK